MNFPFSSTIFIAIFLSPSAHVNIPFSSSPGLGSSLITILGSLHLSIFKRYLQLPIYNHIKANFPSSSVLILTSFLSLPTCAFSVPSSSRTYIFSNLPSLSVASLIPIFINLCLPTFLKPRHHQFPISINQPSPFPPKSSILSNLRRQLVFSNVSSLHQVFTNFLASSTKKS